MTAGYNFITSLI